jgi:hypothetical protein
MHRLIPTALVAICALGIAAPALAAPHMGAQEAPHMVVQQAPHMGVHPVPQMRANRVSAPAHFDRAHRDRDDGHHRGRHRHGFPGDPFGLFDSGLFPDEIGVAPSDAVPYADSAPLVDPAPPAQAEDLPPCRETGAGGVVVLRGTGCQR